MTTPPPHPATCPNATPTASPGRFTRPTQRPSPGSSALMAQQRPPRWQEARRRQYNGSQIVANLQRTAERLYEARRKTLTPAELAAALSRHNAGEGWKPIAADYGMSHTTLMRRVEEEQRAAQLAKRQEQTQ
jgi:hypothetical protein